jgi:YVTN family beta-propeller protein
VNPDNDSVAFFATATKARTGLVSVGLDSQPVSVALHPDNHTAFVALRRAQRLVKVTDIHTVSPQLAAAYASVGSEPTGVALSPTGATAVVTNFGDGTVSFVDTSSMQVLSTVAVGGLPRAVAITNDRDAVDSDEYAYVTLFFGVPVSEATDDGRVGKVVELSLASGAVTATIDLAPISDTGFGPALADGGTGPSVGCSPNQLFSIAINAGKAYVSHVCAAPKGPVFKFTNVFSAVSVIDLSTKHEDTGPTGTVVLSSLVQQQGPATASLLGVPIGIDFRPNTNVAYVVSQAGDVVQRVHFKGTDPRGPVLLGPDAAFAQINIRGAGGIKVPNGIAVAHTANTAFVDNWVDRSLSVIDLATQSLDPTGDGLLSAAKPAAGTPEAQILAGKKFFFTGTGRWADRSVSSCGSCHPDGLSDELTWVFAAGPRQSVSLAGTFNKYDATDQRVLNWTGIFDELHDFELNTRGVSGGKGAITTGVVPNDVAFNLGNGVSLDGGAVVTRNDNLSGSTKAVVALAATVKDWDDIDRYVWSIKAPKAPTGLDAQAVARGRTLFETNNCAFCHGGAKWTVSRVPYTPSPEKNGSLPGANGLPPAATGLRTETRASSLPNALLNTDTLKVDVERLTQADGGVLVVGPERVTCALRIVGTFSGAAAIEKKADGTQAQGALGFNPPSLLGLVTSAPYFHHGGAKTLAGVFEASFAGHHQAASANFLVNGGTGATEQAQIADLVAFLKSIDETTTPFAVPAGQDICVGY